MLLFSHGELSYEVDLSRPLIEELAQSRLGERTVPAYERTEKRRLREVIVRTLPPTSLNTLLTYSQMREKFLSLAFCLYVGAEVAGALHSAHTCKDENGAPLGIVHRDLNPARIFLEPEGGVILTDFARARSLLPGRVASTLPRPHGDVFYCSPEALLCEETDPRSDLFSLGLVLLELATWRHLYSTANVRPGDLEEALTQKVKAQVLDASITAMDPCRLTSWANRSETRMRPWRPRGRNTSSPCHVPDSRTKP